MNKEQQELLDEVYENYESRQTNMYIPIWSQEESINKCKNDSEFSEKWGLKIEYRELSENEINDLKLKLILEYLNKKNIITVSFEDFKNDENKIPNIDWRREAWDMIGWIDYGREGDRDKLKEVYADIKNIPTKLIIITYNDKTNKVTVLGVGRLNT
jgi:hypothetical protein